MYIKQNAGPGCLALGITLIFSALVNLALIAGAIWLIVTILRAMEVVS